MTFCFRNLFRRKVRTALCIAGVALATAFVIAVGATTLRYTTVIREMSVLFNGQVMVVSKDSIVIQAIPLGRSTLPQNHTLGLLQNVTGAGKAIPVLFVTPININERLEPVPPNFSMGIPVEEWRTVLGPTPLKGSVGHFPSNESGNEAVIGTSLADQYNLTVGNRITLSGYDVEIVGILDTKLALLGRSVVMPLKLAQKIYTYPGSVNVIAVSPTEGLAQKQLANAIEQKIDYVKAWTEDERVDMIQPILAQLESWNLGIQTAILLMSLILVMTVMIMSVSERRRDFATLDAIGAPLNYVFRVVIFEAVLIGFLGSILGIFLGSLSALVLASLYTNIPLAQFFPSVFDIVPLSYIVEICVATVAMCCIGGVVPAINAARVRIAEALRAEY